MTYLEDVDGDFVNMNISLSIKDWNKLMSQLKSDKTVSQFVSEIVAGYLSKQDNVLYVHGVDEEL